MHKKILRLLMAYMAVQCVYVGLVAARFELSIFSFILFILVLLLWHIIVYAFLTSNSKAFFYVRDNSPFTDINLANKVTLVRISMLPSLAFHLYHIQQPGIGALLTALLVLVFFSDFLDGYIARRTGEITGIGQILDSTSDYTLLVLISFAYYQHSILENWFVVLVLIRLFLQTIGVMFFLILRYPLKTESTPGGKITVSATMFLYFLELAKIVTPHMHWAIRIIAVGEYLCGIVIFIFTFEKIHIFAKHWRAYKKQL